MMMKSITDSVHESWENGEFGEIKTIMPPTVRIQHAWPTNTGASTDIMMRTKYRHVSHVACSVQAFRHCDSFTIKASKAC